MTTGVGPVPHDLDEQSQPPVDDLAEWFLEGTIIPFLGAGVSSYNRNGAEGALPDSKALAAYLAERASMEIECVLGCPTNGCDNRCSRPLYDLARVSSYYQFCVATREKLNSIIKRTVSDPSVNPSPLHRLLATIASKRNLLIITTNYDNLLERAFDEFNAKAGETRIRYDVVATPVDQLSDDDELDSMGHEYAGAMWVRRGESSSFEAREPKDILVDLSKRSLIYKIHGSLGDESWPGGFLIAEEDYCRFLGRMQTGGIIPANIFNEMRRKTKVAIGPGRTRCVPAHSLLFLGYGMNDWNLRVLLQELKIGSHGPGDENHYAILRDVKRVDTRLLEKRGITPYDCDLGQFVQQLDSRIARLSP
jgi:SIR2-like domain